MPKKLLKCCICNKEIVPDENDWDRGNNALPVKDGRCCDECNWSVVIPARLKKVKNKMDKKELIKRLKECENKGNEDAHIEADELLLQYIDDEEITTIWNKISSAFWYA